MTQQATCTDEIVYATSTIAAYQKLQYLVKFQAFIIGAKNIEITTTFIPKL
jgi:hypothetical protein